MTLNHFPKIVGIAAGKGGVGKSTVTVNLALALALRGTKVGILDADLYGPSLTKMLPPEKGLEEKEGRIIPAFSKGIEYVSLSLFKTGQEAMIVRAPIANQIIEEFLTEVSWSNPDILLIDFPPGTGDIQLTLMQKARLTGALLVTTPQEVSLLDVTKAFQMFRKLQVDVLGVIENMSYMTASSGEKLFPFGSGGGEKFAKEHGLPFLGKIPLEQKIAACCDSGESFFEGHSSEATKEYEKMAKELLFTLMQKEKNKLPAVELLWKDN